MQSDLKCPDRPQWEPIHSSRPRFPPPENTAAPVDASRISLVRVVHSASWLIASIYHWAMGAGIQCSRIWMVISYGLDRVVKICVFMVSSVIFSVVPTNFLWKAISLIQYWVTLSSGDGRDAVNFRRT